MVEQQQYQVRFDWGMPGAHAIGGDADVLVWVDAIDPIDVPLSALPSRCAVVSTGLDGVAETAAWILALQEARQARTSVAIVAAGAQRGEGLRFAVEDLLVSGALLDELEARGIDAMSPEAAAADGAFRVLQPGLRSLMRSVVGAGEPAGGLLVLRPHPDRA